MIRAPWPSTLGQMRAVRPRAGRPARRAISMSPAVEGLEYLVGFVAGERQSEIVLFLGPVLFMDLSWAALPRLGRAWAALGPRPSRQRPRNVRPASTPRLGSFQESMHSPLHHRLGPLHALP